MSENGIRDARKLGAPKMLLLGFQHMFAMFGATVLVPALTGLSVSATLLFAGLGTLLFHFLTKGRVPAFLGSSFAFIGGYSAVHAMCGEYAEVTNWVPYAGVGVVCAGLLYVVLSALFKAFGARKVMRFFPPIVTGPVIICIGLTLANSAISNCSSNWPLALVAIIIVVVFNIWGKGMLKIIPILLGVVISYAMAAILSVAGGDIVSIQTGFEEIPEFTDYYCLFGIESMKLFTVESVENISKAAWVGIPFQFKDTAFSLVENCNMGLLGSTIITIMPIALATMVEHIGDMCAISSTVGENYVENPGLHRTLLGDGLATALAALFGAPANTTYGENTGVLALTKVYDPRVIRIAALLAILFSFSPKFAALVSAMPSATIGGVSLILYGMISSVGVRNVVENKVDFTKNRNVIIAALIMGLTLGIHFSGALGADTVKSINGALSFEIGSVTISLSGLAVGALVGIVLNAILPGNDYKFGEDEQGDTSVNFKV